MARRRRGVRLLKWVGTGLCVLIATGFVVSLWWTLCYVRYSANPFTEFAIVAGRVHFMSRTMAEDYRMWLVGRQQRHDALSDGWYAFYATELKGPSYWTSPSFYYSSRETGVNLPLWLPF